MVTLNTNDLFHILDQIRIAEQHSAGTPLSELVSSPLLPYGLRTVDGAFNNFQPGMERFGAADEPMTRLLDMQFNTADPAPARPGQPASDIPTSYDQFSGNVYDAAPRIISNLVADQSLNNPAALAAALAANGVTGADQLTVVRQIMQALNDLRDAQARAENGGEPAPAAPVTPVDFETAQADRANAVVVLESMRAKEVQALQTLEDAQARKTQADTALASMDPNDAGYEAAQIEAANAQAFVSEAQLALFGAQEDVAIAERNLAAADANLALAQAGEADVATAQDNLDAAIVARTTAESDLTAANQREADARAEFELAQAELDAALAARAGLTGDAPELAVLMTAVTDAETELSAAQVALETATQAVSDADQARQVASDTAALEAARDAAAADVTAAETQLASAEANEISAQEALDLLAADYDAARVGTAEAELTARQDELALAESNVLAAEQAAGDAQAAVEAQDARIAQAAALVQDLASAQQAANEEVERTATERSNAELALQAATDARIAAENADPVVQEDVDAAIAAESQAQTDFNTAVDANDAAISAQTAANQAILLAIDALAAEQTVLDELVSARDAANTEAANAQALVQPAQDAVTAAQAALTEAQSAETAYADAVAALEAAQLAVVTATADRDAATTRLNEAQAAVDAPEAAAAEAQIAYENAVLEQATALDRVTDADAALTTAQADLEAAQTADADFTVANADVDAATAARDAAANVLSQAQSDVTTAEAMLTAADIGVTVAQVALDAATTPPNFGLIAAQNNLDAAQSAQQVAQGNLDTALAEESAATLRVESANQALLDAEAARDGIANANADIAPLNDAVNAAQATFDTAEAEWQLANEAVANAQRALDIANDPTLLDQALASARTAAATAQQELQTATTTLQTEQNDFDALNNGFDPARVTQAETSLATAQVNLTAANARSEQTAQALVDVQAEANAQATIAREAGVVVTRRQAELDAAQQRVTDAGVAFTQAEQDLQQATASREETEANPVLNSLYGDEARAAEAAAQEAFDLASGEVSDAGLALTGAAASLEDAQSVLATANSALSDLQLQRSEAFTAYDAARTAAVEASFAVTSANEELLAANEQAAALEAARGTLENAQAVYDDALIAASEADASLADAEAASLEGPLDPDVAQAQLETAQAAQNTASANRDTAFGVLNSAQADLTAAQSANAEFAAAQQAVSDAQAELDAAETSSLTAQTNVTEARAALTEANGNVADAQAAVDAASAEPMTVAEAEAAVQTLLAENGIQMDGDNVFIKNIAADLGAGASFNGFMTIFGQFFDHGLDLTTKGGSGTVYIPLQPDDPLYVEGSPTNFMVLTRATNEPGPDGVLGTADDIREHRNQTTPWTDLNQIYASNASHQVFLREYTMVDGQPVATGQLLEGATGGAPTWADVKLQAREMLGIELSDMNVHAVPALVTDLYGQFIRGANGLPQLMTPEGVVEGDLTNPVDAMLAVSAGRGFLDDIAHNAVPGTFIVDRTTGETAEKTPDADTETGNVIVPNQFGQNATYDNELLDRHYIVGDGRGNENIALTSVHTVFHGEHNRQVEAIKAQLVAEGDVTFLNEWLLTPVTEIPADMTTLTWNGDRLFQAARFSTEMVYQHLVFEEFVRAISPQIDPFVFSNSVEIDGAIFEEFAQVVYRFGHSMLNENVEMLKLVGNTATTEEVGLIEAFLNPVLFDEQGADAHEAAGAILRGMTRQAGNEIDEFTTSALRNNLVGLPLDLAALNMTRARETGIPSLNEARRQIFEQTNDTFLKPYESWTDYAGNLKNPLSVVNFIASYGTHDTITSAVTVADKRDAAWALVFGGENAPADRLDFVNGTGSWAGVETGLNSVDFWIGGLAEALMPFGGMLGSTFNFVFELQIENLQAGDRFYYLSRTQGMNLLTQLEGDSFADLINRNTDTEETGIHINGAAFQTADFALEMDQSKQINPDLGSADPTRGDDVATSLQGNNQLVFRTDVDGDGDTDVIRFTGDQHTVIGGTSENDTIIGGAGDDALWGGDGDDSLEGGFGVDHIHGGRGNDIITDAGTDIGDADVIKGEEGDDVINAGMGLDLVFGGSGSDVLSGGSEAKSLFGGEGNDFMRSASGGGGVVYGNEGNDWMEGQGNMNTLTGDNSELFFNSRVIGHDVMISGENDTDFDAESGDDIMVQGIGINRNNGMAGFDWTTYQGNEYAADADMNISIFVNQQNNILRDRYDLVEGMSGWNYDDTLRGRDAVLGAYDANGNAIQVNDNAIVESFSNALLEKNIDLIDGLRELVAHLERFEIRNPNGTTDEVQIGVMDTSDASDILLGGAGSDTIEGRAGNDIIDGDKFLQVRIAITNAAGEVFATADKLTSQVMDAASGTVLFGGATLENLLFGREIEPRQLNILREIVDGGAADDVDTAVFWDVLENYEIVSNADGSVTVTHLQASVGEVDPVTGIDPTIDPNTGRNRGLEGSDRLFNVEMLQFADQTVAVADFVGTNEPVTGLPVILDVSPTETLPVSVDLSQIADADGIAAVSVQWQSSTDGGVTWTDIAGATSETFTPPAGTLGNQPQLRVAATVTDSLGVTSTVFSASTDVVGEVISANNQGTVITGGAGGDLIDGNRGNDTINAGASDDVIVWNAANDGRDIVDGGTETIAGDTFVVNGNNSAETFRVYSVEAWQALGGNRTVAAGTEIVVTRNGTGNANVIAELQEIEEIVINTGGGAFLGFGDFDQVAIIGDFAPTNLSFNTITINGSAGDETVDISGLSSAHRILFRTEGGNDVVVGTLRAQDVIEAPAGIDPASYVASFDEATGMVTLTTTGSTITFSGTLDNLPQVAPATDATAVASTVNPFSLADAEGLLALVRGTSPDGNDDGVFATGVRDLPGLDNNLDNPGFGAAGEPYIRITDAYYAGVDPETGAGIINPVFQGLDPRAISNVLGAQEAETPQSDMANTFFMAFGQYFDHGLTFIPKGGAGSIEIGGPGSSRNPGVDNPADLTRASVFGLDENGVPQHVNITSPFVDQNQVYGSSSLIGQLLRESDGNGGVGARVLLGEPDPSAPEHDLLPTLRKVLDHHIEAGTVFTGANLADGMTLLDYYPNLRDADGNYDAAVVAEMSADFMGEGWPLFIDSNPYIDLLDHIVAGDGRVNENITLTSMHTIFARNHNYHVENLAEVYVNQGISISEEELFQAAKIVNEAEYQRVVFTEFSEKLLGGQGIMGTGDHGFADYVPETDARISHEFAAAAYRIGHTMIGQTINVLDANGNTVEVPLFDAFLNPTNDPNAFMVPDMDGAGPMQALEGQAAVDALGQMGYVPQPGYSQIGAAAVLGGIVQQPSEEVDVNIVDAVRNDLVRISADLFSFNVARGWDVGLGTLNQVRADLMASTNPYIAEAVGFAGGDLSPYTSWEDFQTRNNLSDALIAQFREAYPDLVLSGDEIAAFSEVNPNINLLDNGDGTMTVAGIDRVDLWVGGIAEAKINGGMAGQTFWVILHEQMDRLQEGDRFYYLPRLENFDLYANFVEGQGFAEIVMRNTGLTGLDERIFEVSNEDAFGPTLPAIDQPVTEEPVAEEPAVQPPVTEEPVAEEPVVQPPVTEEPVAEEPVVQPPVTEEPAAEEPVVQPPVTEEPAAEEPAVQPPVIEEPVAEEPTAEEPVAAGGDDTSVGSLSSDLIVGGVDENELVGGDLSEILWGGAGFDVLDAGDGDDQLNGGDQADLLNGGAGADVLVGGSGDDMMSGGDGRDVLRGGDDHDILDGGAGNDQLDGGDGSDVLRGGDGNDLLIASADSEFDTYDGGSGIDTLRLDSAFGDVEIELGNMDGEGWLSFDGADDHLVSIENVRSGSGNDVISSGQTANQMWGGAGNDVFRMTSAEAATGDAIMDFAAGDQIDLSAIDIEGAESFTLMTACGSTGAGSLVVTEDGSTSTVSGHTDDDGVADFTFTVKGKTGLNQDDFLL